MAAEITSFRLSAIQSISHYFRNDFKVSPVSWIWASTGWDYILWLHAFQIINSLPHELHIIAKGF